MPTHRGARKGKSQRFYARNIFKTTMDLAFEHLMPPISAYRAAREPADIHPVLQSFADECCAVILPLLAYIGGLAILAVAVSCSLSSLPDISLENNFGTSQGGWTQARRPHPVFALAM